MLRHIWPVLLGVGACAVALLLFDWAAVAEAARRFDTPRFLALALPASLLFLACQTLRWAAVAGISFTARALLQAHAQMAVATALAVVTPLQAGEALKLKLARDSAGISWARLTAAFTLERLADFAVLGALAALALALPGAHSIVLALVALAVATLLARVAIGLDRRVQTHPLARRFIPRVATLGTLHMTRARIFAFGVGTALKWVAVVVMWQAVFKAIGIYISPVECAAVVALVAMIVLASLVPGGIGVAELATSSLLTMFGFERSLAEAGAVLLRLLTPLLALVGVTHALGLFFLRWRAVPVAKCRMGSPDH